MLGITITLGLAATLSMTNTAQAAPNCTEGSKDQWMSEEAMRARVATLGYERIRTFKVSGNCYEIYGYTKDGEKAEVYFNPVNGDVVKANIGG